MQSNETIRLDGSMGGGERITRERITRERFTHERFTPTQSKDTEAEKRRLANQRAITIEEKSFFGANGSSLPDAEREL